MSMTRILVGALALAATASAGASGSVRCVDALDSPVAIFSGWQDFDPLGAPLALPGALPLRAAAPSTRGDVCAWRATTPSGHTVELALGENLSASERENPVFILRVLGPDGRIQLIDVLPPGHDAIRTWRLANPCAAARPAAAGCVARRFRPGFVAIAPSAAAAAPSACPDPAASELARPAVRATGWPAEDADGNEMRLDGTYELAPAYPARRGLVFGTTEVCRWEAVAPTGQRLSLSLARDAGRVRLGIAVTNPDGTPIASAPHDPAAGIEGIWPVRAERGVAHPIYLGSLLLATTAARLASVKPDLVDPLDRAVLHANPHLPRQPGAVSDQDAESRRLLVPAVLDVLKAIGRAPKRPLRPLDARGPNDDALRSEWLGAIDAFALLRPETKRFVKLLAPALEHPDPMVWKAAMHAARDLGPDAAPLLPALARAARRIRADRAVHEQDVGFAAETIGLVGRGHEQDALPALLDALAYPATLRGAVAGLAALGSPRPSVMSALGTRLGPSGTGFDVAAAFVELGGSSPAALPALREKAAETLVADGKGGRDVMADLERRRRAISALARAGDVDGLAAVLLVPSLDARQAAEDGLESLGGAAAAEALARHVRTERGFALEQRLRARMPQPLSVRYSNAVITSPFEAIWELRWDAGACALDAARPPPLNERASLDGAPREVRWDLRVARSGPTVPALLLEQRGDAARLRIDPVEGWASRASFRCAGLLVVEPDGRIVARLAPPPQWDPARPLRFVALAGRIYAAFPPRPGSEADRQAGAIAVEIDPVTLRFVDARRVDFALLEERNATPPPPPGEGGFGTAGGRVRTFRVGGRVFVDAT